MGEGERVSCTQHSPSRLPDLVATQGLWGYCIYAEFLPAGNFAKLQPPDNQDLMGGCEIKVQLGSVWKASLTELSGGQRYAEFIIIITLTTVSYLCPSCMYKGRLSRYL
jgi:hypothetical protein